MPKTAPRPQQTSLPTPLTAALGLVVTGVERAKRVPADAARLPLVTLQTVLVVRASFLREYEELAERGQTLVARLRGHAEVLEDTVTDEVITGVATGVHAGRTATRAVRTSVVSGARDALETAADKVEDVAAIVAGDPSGAVRNAEEAIGRGFAGDEIPVATPPAEQPKSEPTPAQETGGVERVDTAASAEVVAQVEQATESVDVPAGEDIAHGELPLPDYDHMTLGSLRGRLRKLTIEQLVTLREYEKAHANRLPVVTMLDNRIAKLQQDPSQQPAGDAAPDPATASRESQQSAAKSTQQSLAKGTGAEHSHQPGAGSSQTKAAMITS